MRRVVLIGLAALAVVGVVGFRVLANRGDSTTAADQAAPLELPVATVVVKPVTTDDHGVRHGYPRDAAGAVDAAVAALELTGPIARAGFITRSDMIASLASARFAPTLANESANQLAEMTTILGDASLAPDALVWSELPLTARLVRVTDREAQVEVWAVLVVGVVNLGAPRQAWRTVTIDLVWESGDWKVDGWVAAPGPTPMLDGTAAIATTEQITEVVAWPSAGGA
jgi:hypothetical protein